MAVLTYEGVVENGRIRLREEAALPEHARVYVVVPDPVNEAPIAVRTPAVVHLRSPRLANPADAKYFVLDVSEERHGADRD